MNDDQKNNENSFENIKNKREKNKKSYLESDTEDIIRQLSQITQSDDKSFESSMMNTKNFPKFYENISDKNKLSKDNYIEPFVLSQKHNKRDIKTDINDNIIINNKYSTLNHKLNYICSLIQISNINIKKYEDLRQFNKFLYNNNLIINHFEPINILFDIISDFIFDIQKEVKNSDILMREIRRLKYNLNDKDKQIYKLKSSIKEKDKELNELRAIKKDEYFKYNLNEINELKQENKELYKKINTYKSQMKKVESSNKVIQTKLNYYNDKVKKRNYFSNNNLNCIKLNNYQSLFTITDLNNSDDETRYNILKNSIKIQRNSINNSNQKYKTINNSACFSPNKTYSCRKINEKKNYRNIINKVINFKENYNKGASIILNMRLLLKEINEMLNKYNSYLDKIKIGNNNKSNKNNNIFLINPEEHQNQIITEDKNINFINKEFFKKMDNLIKKMENYMKENNNNKNQKNKKIIQVNTSRFILKKRTFLANELPKNNLNKGKINYNSSSNLRSAKFFKKGSKINLTDNSISSGYRISLRKKLNRNIIKNDK